MSPLLTDGRTDGRNLKIEQFWNRIRNYPFAMIYRSVNSNKKELQFPPIILFASISLHFRLKWFQWNIWFAFWSPASRPGRGWKRDTRQVKVIAKYFWERFCKVLQGFTRRKKEKNIEPETGSAQKRGHQGQTRRDQELTCRFCFVF